MSRAHRFDISYFLVLPRPRVSPSGAALCTNGLEPQFRHSLALAGVPRLARTASIVIPERPAGPKLPAAAAARPPPLPSHRLARIPLSHPVHCQVPLPHLHPMLRYLRGGSKAAAGGCPDVEALLAALEKQVSEATLQAFAGSSELPSGGPHERRTLLLRYLRAGGCCGVWLCAAGDSCT